MVISFGLCGGGPLKHQRSRIGPRTWESYGRLCARGRPPAARHTPSGSPLCLSWRHLSMSCSMLLAQAADTRWRQEAARPRRARRLRYTSCSVRLESNVKSPARPRPTGLGSTRVQAIGAMTREPLAGSEVRASRARLCDRDRVGRRQATRSESVARECRMPLWWDACRPAGRAVCDGQAARAGESRVGPQPSASKVRGGSSGARHRRAAHRGGVAV